MAAKPVRKSLPNVQEKENRRKPGDGKYANYAQLVQGVCQVNDPTLTQGEQCFLNCLAAHSLKEHPHPGNAILIRACRVSGRTGVNHIAKKLIAKKLIEVVAFGKGGHGMATVYRIRTEDDRFPSPKKSNPPSTPDWSVGQHVPSTPDCTVETSNRPVEHSQPSSETVQPYSPDWHPNLKAEYKNELNPHAGTLALPIWIDPPAWHGYLESRKVKPKAGALMDYLSKLRNAGFDVNQELRTAAATCGMLPKVNSKAKPKFPGSDTRQDHLDRFVRNAAELGLTPEQALAAIGIKPN
jgi:hypothetical protein